MEYLVKNVETADVKILSHTDVNDMVYDDHGQVIVFDTDMVGYVLLSDD